MFHLTQILVPLIVGGQQRHSDDSIGEGGLCEAADHPRVGLSLAFLPASGAVLPSACAGGSFARAASLHQTIHH